MARAEAPMASRGTLPAMDQGTTAASTMAVFPRAWDSRRPSFPLRRKLSPHHLSG